MTKWQLALRLVGVGWFIAFCEVLGVLGGLWLDKKINTTPIFSLVGVTLGTFVALFGVYRMLRSDLIYKKPGKDEGGKD